MNEPNSKALKGFIDGGVGGVMMTIITLVIGIIGLQIINATMYNGTTGTIAPIFGGLLKTVMDNIPVLLGVGLLVAAVSWAFAR